MNTKPDLDGNVEGINDEGDATKGTATEHKAMKSTRNWYTKVFQIYLFAAAIGFVILAVLASMYDYFPVDLRITQALQSIDAAWFANLMWWVSYPGYGPQSIVLVGATGFILYAKGLRWEAVMTLASTASGAGLGEVIKVLVHRPRPGVDLITVLLPLSSYSFPSGHVLSYTIFLGFLFFSGFTLLKASSRRTVGLTILGSMTGLVGISRIYLGEHWASDVVGGYLLGSLWLALSIHIYRWGKTRFFIKQSLPADTAGPT